MDPYGGFMLGLNYIHYVTFFCIVALGVIIYYRTKKHITIKILTAAIYTFAGLMLYEVWWNIGWFYMYPYSIGWFLRDFVSFVTIFIVLVWTPNTLRKTLKLDIPQVNWGVLVIIFMIMPFLILWLQSTGFYVNYLSYHLKETTVNPHNFAWAVGKTISLMYWVLIPTKEML